jgi:hypothetical protein
MVAFTCEKCRRRFTLTAEEMQGYLANSRGKKHALVLCPHCGKANKVDPQRLQQALRLSPAVPGEAASQTQSAASAADVRHSAGEDTERPDNTQ